MDHERDEKYAAVLGGDHEIHEIHEKKTGDCWWGGWVYSCDSWLKAVGGTTKYTKYTKRSLGICGGYVGFIRVIRG